MTDRKTVSVRRFEDDFARFAVERALEDVEFASGISADAIRGACRTRRITRARWVWWWLVREIADTTIAETARLCGGRHHTTLLHAFRQAEDDPAFLVIRRRLLDYGGRAP